MPTKNIITVDWEDWFHICEVDHLLPRGKWDSYPSILPEATEILLDFFKTHNSTATFFILGYCADRFPELVKKIAEAGHELAYHSQDHALVYDRSQEEFRADITHGRNQLEQLGLQPVLGFRAPQWSLNDRCPWGLEELVKAGYTYDSSHTPLPIIGNPNYPEQVHPLHTISGSLLEFPPLVLNIAGVKMPAGGGWGLKTWPMPIIKGKMRKHNRAGSPATFFIHPVDVMETTPQIALPLVKRLVTCFGVRKPLQALRSLLQHTELISIHQYMEQNT
jgi:polysaccharide deacetylase family protein (PEP-CTERM system associated)